MNMLKKIKYNMALQKVARLEREREFISPFFCGETLYPIQKAKNEKALEAAKRKLEEAS